MKIHSSFSDQFMRRKLKRSDAGKIVLKYDGSRYSDELLRFLTAHRSFRVAFNAMVKNEFVSVERTLAPLPKLLADNKTSLVFVACCMCKNTIDRPRAWDLIEDFSKSSVKSLSCTKCGKRNSLSVANYAPYAVIDIRDILNPFFHEAGKLFSVVLIKECLVCGKQVVKDTSDASLTLNLSCEDCTNITYLSPQIFPHSELKDLATGGQGYWFDWYVWRLVKDKYPSEVGVEIIAKEKYEIDVLVLRDGRKIFIECKDTTDGSFVHKLHALKKDCDYYVLVSTCVLPKDSIATAKSILRKKFVYVRPFEVENLPQILSILV